MQMPQMDGLALAAEIRKHPERQELPLVMLTSIGKPKPGDQAVDVNLSTCLNKPVKQTQLHSVLLWSLNEELFKVVPATTITKFDSQVATTSVQPLRILLAEDNLVNQKVALLMLQRIGYQADVAGNGLEVLEALQQQLYDVVLMDVQMPEMDGLEAASQICQRWKPPSRPRIIAMTANAMQGDRELCIHAGMDDYLTKPIQVEELVKALGKCQPNIAKEQGIWGSGENEEIISSALPHRVLPLCTPASLDAKALQIIRDMAGEGAEEVIKLSHPVTEVTRLQNRT